MDFKGRMKEDQYFINSLYFVNLHIKKLRIEISTTIGILCFAYVVRTEHLRQVVNKKDTEKEWGEEEREP